MGRGHRSRLRLGEYLLGSDARSAAGRFGTGPNAAGTASEVVSLRWLSTLRARIGFAVRDRVLLYAIGGLAVGGINTQASVAAFSPVAAFA
jgi:opacity protein-like surface antigen